MISTTEDWRGLAYLPHRPAAYECGKAGTCAGDGLHEIAACLAGTLRVRVVDLHVCQRSFRGTEPATSTAWIELIS